ncbi:MAG: pyruvate kinase [Actinobacteria bacterium]|nr:pyruvate kinase [Actinomycetota bacterium]
MDRGGRGPAPGARPHDALGGGPATRTRRRGRARRRGRRPPDDLPPSRPGPVNAPEEPGRPNTKLVVTLGPATRNAAMVRSLAEAGAALFRVNLSHGTPQDHAEAVRLVREAEGALGRSLGVMADLPGPKGRLGRLSVEPLELEPGRSFVLRPDGGPGDGDGAPVSYAGLGSDVRPGDRILLADGAVELVVRESGREVATEVVRGGAVRSRSGVNPPSERLGLPPVTDADREALARALDLGVDLVAQSFVRRVEDLEELRALMGDRRVPLVAKIETRMAVEAAGALVESAEGVMVARGDLGVELPMEEIPVLQKELITRARGAGTPAIVATQMLESMLHASRPTRAEASDVANAVLDGADAVMLSGETAIGEFPVEAARTAAGIARVAERRGRLFEAEGPDCRHRDGPSAIAHAAAEVAAQHPDAAAIACFTRTGRTAALLAGERPRVPIHAFAPVDGVRRALCLQWGVRPWPTEVPPHTDAMIAGMEEGLLARGLAADGDVIVMVASSPVGYARTNLLKVHRIGGPRTP